MTEPLLPQKDSRIDFRTYSCQYRFQGRERERPHERDDTGELQPHQGMIQENYNRIKAEVKQIVADELQRIQNDPALAHLLQIK